MAKRALANLNLFQTAAIVFLILAVACGVLAAVFAPFDPNSQSLRNALLPPLSTSSGGIHVLGTDYLGRDLLSRLIFGARVSLLIGLSTVGIAGTVGFIIGLSAGFFGGWWDLVLSYFMDMQMSIPFFVLALTVASIVKPGLVSIIGVLVVTSWPTYARIARSVTLSVVDQDFVEAARALGVSRWRMLFRHLTPNIVGVVVAFATVEVARAILTESALSFLGVGVPSSMPSWGYMTAEGRDLLGVAWWISTFPGLAILCTAVSIAVVGDYLQRRFKVLGG